MKHSGLAHPEFGFLSPTPRLRRELRIAAIALLLGGIAGAVCVSGVVAVRDSDRAATEVAEAPHPAASQKSEAGTGPSTDARATMPESHAGPTQGTAEAPAQPSGESRESGAAPAHAVAPASAIMPKPRMVRIRKTVESPAIARLPLGRTQAAAAAPPADPLPSSPTAVAAVSADNGATAPAPDVSAAEKAVAGSGAKEAVHSSPAKKKVQKTARARRNNDIENDPWLRDDRPENWRARADAVNDARNPAGRAYAREASSFRGFWDWSR